MRRKRIMGWALLSLAILLLPFILVLGWVYWSSIRVVDNGTARIGVCDGVLCLDGKPVLEHASVFDLNSHEDLNDNNWVLRWNFRHAVARVQHQLGVPPVYLRVTDMEGWEFLRAYWQLPSGFVYVSMGSGNDSDTVYLSLGPGQYDWSQGGFSQLTTRPAKADDWNGIFIR